MTKKTTTIAIEMDTQRKLLDIKHEFENYYQKCFSFSKVIDRLCEEHKHNLE